MYLFLIPLLLGFLFNSASAFTAFYSHYLGVRGGILTSVVLRDVIGIPVWALGYALAARATSNQLFSLAFITSVFVSLLMLAGVVIICAGLISLRWRAAAPSVRDSLVAHGIYNYIRHPLYSGMILELIGLFLWIPTLSVMITCILGLVWVMIQARLEEMDLVVRMPTY
jgi:protein-S-isoprenylcysteine O-methyltransferase Ste14